MSWVFLVVLDSVSNDLTQKDSDLYIHDDLYVHEKDQYVYDKDLYVHNKDLYIHEKDLLYQWTVPVMIGTIVTTSTCMTTNNLYEAPICPC